MASLRDYKGLVPLREPNGKRSRKVGRPTLNIGFEGAKKRRKGLIAHTCAIYAIECPGLSAVKIGTARNVASRLEALQVGQTFELFVFGALRAEEQAVRKLEMSIHKALAGTPDHLKGEWYRFSVVQAHDTIQRFAEKVGLVLHDDHQYPFGDLTMRAASNRVVTDREFGGAPKIWRIWNGDWVAGLI